jgi:hypothetical protein
MSPPSLPASPPKHTPCSLSHNFLLNATSPNCTMLPTPPTHPPSCSRCLHRQLQMVARVQQALEAAHSSDENKDVLWCSPAARVMRAVAFAIRPHFC